MLGVWGKAIKYLQHCTEIIAVRNSVFILRGRNIIEIFRYESHDPHNYDIMNLVTGL